MAGQEGDKSVGDIHGVNMQQDGRVLLAQQAFKAEDEAAPDSKLGRWGAVTVEGAKNFVPGIGNALWHDITHPVQTGEMLLGSAAFGAVLKTALPEGGPTGVIAGLGIGAWMMAKSAAPVIDAYSKASDAKTMKQIQDAGVELGNASGTLLVDTGVSVLGYKLGAGAANRALMSESLDGFAESKARFWHAADAKFSPLLERVGIGSTEATVARAQSLGIASRIKVDGDMAELLNSDRAAPQGILRNASNPDQTMSVSVMLKSKATDFAMDRHLSRIAAGQGSFLTDSQFAQRFGPDPTAVDALNKFAKANSLTIADQNMTTGRVVLKGTVGQMENAFDVKLHDYEHATGAMFRGRQGTISLPTELASKVEGVFGLDTRPQFSTHYVKLNDILPPGEKVNGFVANASQPHGVKSLTPEQMFKAYNAPAEMDGKGLGTAFVSLGGTLPEGWEAALQKKGIDPATVRQINTSDSPLTPDPQGANGENALDFFIHKQGLPKAVVTMVSGENSDNGFISTIDRASFPKPGEQQNVAVSISWGAPEDQWTAQGIRGMELAAKKAALKGVTITAASGDDGAVDRSPTHKAQADFPSSGQWFTGVGGTTLSVDAQGNWAGEKTWSGNGATGGGRSLKVERPDYQAGVKMPDNINPAGAKFDGRGVPDVAFAADPRSGWIVYTDEGMQSIGGTSAASPAAAVISAKIFQATGKPVGFWNPALYEFGKNNPGVYRDVTVGNNDGYPAGPGWDATTGWGSIHVQKMIDAIKGSKTGGGSNLSNLMPSLFSGQTIGSHTDKPGT
jgi:kumamolisin